MKHAAERDAQIVQMYGQLDENSRTIEMQKMEITRLREQVHRLADDGALLSGSVGGSGGSLMTPAKLKGLGSASQPGAHGPGLGVSLPSDAVSRSGAKPAVHLPPARG